MVSPNKYLFEHFITVKDVFEPDTMSPERVLGNEKLDNKYEKLHTETES